MKKIVMTRMLGGVAMTAAMVVMSGTAHAQDNVTSVADAVAAIDAEVTMNMGNSPLVDGLAGLTGDALDAALIDASGFEVASGMQSMHNVGANFNDLLGEAAECEIPEVEGRLLACDGDGLQIWVQSEISSYTHEAGDNGPKADADQWVAMLGINYPVGENANIGIGGARISNHHDVSTGGGYDLDGWQIGGYANYDPGSYYFRVVGSYGWYDGDVERNVDAGTFSASYGGDADLSMYTVGVHAGVRILQMAEVTATPFVHVDHVGVDLDNYLERSDPDADLGISGKKESRTYATIGSRFAMNIGDMVAEAELGWREMFGDNEVELDAGFARYSDADFTLYSNHEKSGSAVAGMSFGFKAGPADFRIGYRGIFNGDATTHSGRLRLILPF